MTRKGHEFRWTEREDEVFKELKRRFISEPLLNMFDPTKPIVRETNASNYTIGVCLS